MPYTLDDLDAALRYVYPVEYDAMKECGLNRPVLLSMAAAHLFVRAQVSGQHETVIREALKDLETHGHFMLKS